MVKRETGDVGTNPKFTIIHINMLHATYMYMCINMDVIECMPT